MKTCISTLWRLAPALLWMACGSSQTGTNEDALLYAQSPYNLRIHLTDKPMDEVKSVWVNIDHVELRVERGEAKGWVVIAQDLGMVDLLTLRNGVLLPVADLKVPAGVDVTQIRLVLKPENNYLVKTDDSECELKTPSQQKTGIKLLIKDPVHFEDGFKYSLVVDFDVDHSIVLQGNGRCLLKPVLKLKSSTRVVDDGNEDPEPTPEPTSEPTPMPTAEPTPEPTSEPTPAPTASPMPTMPPDYDYWDDTAPDAPMMTPEELANF